MVCQFHRMYAHALHTQPFLVLTARGSLFSGSQTTEDTEITAAALATCHRSLIYLGDLERYRQLCEDESVRDWSKASEYYLEALRLLPHSGEPCVLRCFRLLSCLAYVVKFTRFPPPNPFGNHLKQQSKRHPALRMSLSMTYSLFLCAYSSFGICPSGCWYTHAFAYSRQSIQPVGRAGYVSGQ